MAGLDQKFQDKAESVAKHAEATAAGQINQGQVAWDTLDDQGPDGPGPLRFSTSFHAEFDRTELGKQYVRVYSEKSGNQDDIKTRVSEISLTRTQYDWLMQVERDFLMRRRSRIRTEAHAAAVRTMIGDQYGPVLNGIMRVARQILARAAETEN